MASSRRYPRPPARAHGSRHGLCGIVIPRA
jgi:hypothetical protein